MAITLACKSNRKLKLYLNDQEQHYLNRVIALLDFVIDFDRGISGHTSRQIESAINTALEDGKLLEFTHNNNTIPYMNHNSRKLPGTVHPVSGEHLIVLRKFCDFVPRTLGIHRIND